MSDEEVEDPPSASEAEDEDEEEVEEGEEGGGEGGDAEPVEAVVSFESLMEAPTLSWEKIKLMWMRLSRNCSGILVCFSKLR